MSVINVNVCDGCGSRGKEGDSAHPKGWISIRSNMCHPCVVRSDHGCDPSVSLMIVNGGCLEPMFPGSKESIDFCSVDCLYQFAKGKTR